MDFAVSYEHFSIVHLSDTLSSMHYAETVIAACGISERLQLVWYQVQVSAWKVKHFPMKISNTADDAVEQEFARKKLKKFRNVERNITSTAVGLFPRQ